MRASVSRIRAVVLLRDGGRSQHDGRGENSARRGFSLRQAVHVDGHSEVDAAESVGFCWSGLRASGLAVNRKTARRQGSWPAGLRVGGEPENRPQVGVLACGLQGWR